MSFWASAEPGSATGASQLVRWAEEVTPLSRVQPRTVKLVAVDANGGSVLPTSVGAITSTCEIASPQKQPGAVEMATSPVRHEARGSRSFSYETLPFSEEKDLLPRAAYRPNDVFFLEETRSRVTRRYVKVAISA